MNDEMTDFELARAVHEVHRAIACAQGANFLNAPFDALPPSRQEVVINMVRLIKAGATREQIQDAWVERMRERGFKWGEVKDLLASPPTHPGMLPWGKLGKWDRRKVDAAFSLVRELTREDG